MYVAVAQLTGVRVACTLLCIDSGQQCAFPDASGVVLHRQSPGSIGSHACDRLAILPGQTDVVGERVTGNSGAPLFPAVVLAIRA